MFANKRLIFHQTTPSTLYKYCKAEAVPRMKSTIAYRSFSSKFKLPKDFVDLYRAKPVKFGFNGLGEIAYIRTYSRIREDGHNEEWADTVERIVNGCFSIQSEFTPLKNDDPMTMPQAMRMYDKIYNFKFLPPGRGIWAMGSAITEEKKLYTALNN